VIERPDLHLWIAHKAMIRFSVWGIWS